MNNKFECSCGEVRFIQFFVEITKGDWGKMSEYCKDPSLLNYDPNSQWKYYCVDVDTQRPDCGFKGVYNKQMNLFLDRNAKVEPFLKCYFLDQQAGGEERSCFEWVVYLDIDNFKAVNDNLSERIGDEMIAFFANQIKNYFQEILDLMLVRKGGDEFLLYYMSKPICGRETRSSLSINQEKIKNNLENAKEEMEETGVTIYIPNTDHSPHMLHLTNAPVGVESSQYLYRYELKGLQFKYGIGTTPDLAYKKCKKKDPSEDQQDKPSRGNFSKEMKIKIGGSEWMALNDYLFLIINIKEIPSLDEGLELIQKLIKLLSEQHGYEVKESPGDSFGQTKVLIITQKVEESGKEILRNEAMQKIIKIINDDCPSLDGDSEHIKSKELEYIYRLSGSDIRPKDE